MGWKDDDIREQAAREAVILVILGVLWLGIRSLLTWSVPSPGDAEILAAILIIMWAVGLWRDTRKAEMRSLQQAMEQLKEKLDSESVARHARQRVDRDFWSAASILSGIHFASKLLHWLFGRPASIDDIDKTLLFLGGLYLVREFLGYKAWLIELRFRTVQINDRLAAIEQGLSDRRKPE